MRTQKRTVFITLALAIFFLIIMIASHFINENKLLAEIIINVTCGISTGMIVSCIIALVNYYIMKQNIIHNAILNLRSLYVNLKVTKEVTCNILLKIYDYRELRKLGWQTVSDLSKYNIDLYKNIDP